MKNPNEIHSEEELEELLSRPTDPVAASMQALDGDLLILGAGGKMGPSLARLAKRAAPEKRIIAVSRFTDRALTASLESDGVQTISCDLLEAGSLASIPDVKNIIFMAARKFGTTGAEHLTWAMNTYLPGLVAERFRESRIVAFSTGNVYPLRPVAQGGALESDRPAPVGEYGQSALGRERMFEYGSHRWGTPVCLLRLNYAIDLRYGVLNDIGRAVHEGRPVDLRMGLVNIIWQGDANSVCLRALAHCSSPPETLNLTGPETLSIRYIAQEFARLFAVEAIFSGSEESSALLSNAAKAHQFFGYPTVTAGEMIGWTADWIQRGGATHNKPTKFQVRDGSF